MESFSYKSVLEDPLVIRNTGINEAPLEYQSMEAVEKSGIPFCISLSLKIIDVCIFLLSLIL